MASYKLVGKNNWRANVSFTDLQGKRIRKQQQGFRKKSDAELWAKGIEDKYFNINQNIDTILQNMTLEEFIFKWFNEYKVFNVSINTRNDYLSRINTHIVPMIGHYKINELTTAAVQDFYNKLIFQKGIKAVSAKKVIDILNGCLKYAKKNKIISELPTDIEKQKLEKPRIQFWTKSEIDFFLDTIYNTYLYTPIFLSVMTGLRIAELCGLRWCDIDLVNGILTVNNQLLHDKKLKTLSLSNLKTTASYRKMILPSKLINYLKDVKSIRKAGPYDFIVLDKKGSPYVPRNLSMNFKKKVAKYEKSIDELKDKGIEIPEKYMQLNQITFHGLRHTHATILIANGENIKVVSERLGHTDIKITLNTYAHVMDTMRTSTAILLDSIFE